MNNFLIFAVITIVIMSLFIYLLYISTDCPTGQYLNNGKCEYCIAGMYSSQGKCLPCPEGTYSLKGSGSCSNCPAGQFASMMSSECEKCKDYEYWNHVCLPCPINSIPNKDKTNCVPTSIIT